MSMIKSLRWTDWLFTALMLALTATCLFLGNWQMDRLSEKEALIAAVDTRLDAEPVPAPSPEAWPTLDLDAWNFQPVSLTGQYRYTQTATVFTSLANARGRYAGPGFWVMTPFVLVGGGTVFVNRGFVPQDLQEAAALGDLHGDDPGTVTISGLFRAREVAGFMSPDPNMSDRIEWVRDPVRLANMVDPTMTPIAPFYVDLPAMGEGELPQGGETVVTFTNNHLGYAITWYGFAVVAIVMLGAWLWRQGRRRSVTH